VVLIEEVLLFVVEIKYWSSRKSDRSQREPGIDAEDGLGRSSSTRGTIHEESFDRA
jgi:hypothetical protein